MIEIISNCNGYSAVCEYVLVDKEGKHQKQGEYLYIADLQIAENYRRKGQIKQLIKQFLTKFPQLKYCYFKRHTKYPNKTFTFHSRREYEKLIKEDKNEEMG
jgi:hypothetical protein